LGHRRRRGERYATLASWMEEEEDMRERRRS